MRVALSYIVPVPRRSRVRIPLVWSGMNVMTHGGHMDSRFGDNGVVDRDCGMEGDDVPRRLAEDIGCAARSEMPVLITGGPEQGREIACAIDRYSRTPKGAVEVV